MMTAPRKRALIFFACLTLLGGGFLGLLYANRRPAAAPARAVWSPPAKPVRVVSYNILHSQRGIGRVVEEVRRLNPDFVLLQEVEKRDLSQMTRELGMLPPAVYHASENLAGPRASWGNAILSKHRLYEGGSIPNPGGGSFGVWATASIEDRKFVVACVHLAATWKADPAHLIESGNARWKELSNLVAAWHGRGSPPIVVGGDFNQIPMGNNYALMTREWSDALGVLGKDQTTFKAGLLRTRIDYFMVSKGWGVAAGDVVESDASDHKPIWVEVGGR